MVFCGLKLTHDGSIALIDEGKLMFSIELEKLNNNKRYTSLEDTADIAHILATQGYAVDDIDQFVIDGWGGYSADELAVQPRLTIGENHNLLAASNRGVSYQLPIAQYHERPGSHQVLEELQFDGLRIGADTVSYRSYLHVTGHILSAYCTSPFAERRESAFVLVWDGGMFPRLYYVNALTRQIENLGPIFLLIGNIYTIFSQHFGPFKVNGNFAKDSLSVAGKVMAYIALGNVRRELFARFNQIYTHHYDKPMGFANHFANEFKQQVASLGYSDEDILATFHAYLEELLVAKLQKKMERVASKTRNLCYAGGCALNIKWNSALRSCGLFDQVYVPPFPNDSGSAIGIACAAMVNHEQHLSLDWNVYSGPSVLDSELPLGWTPEPCSPAKLAALLHETGEPVVFLNGRAELGPRALGNRSILAPATSPRMKDTLNEVKKRERYRPVSPICLEHRATVIFEPGTPDPYMLFDHQVKTGWTDQIPAICHLDGSARLQTVNKAQNPVVTALLEAYEALSGVPLLCNTSANYNGSGFFPDVASATGWGRTNYVWCDGTLYCKDNQHPDNTGAFTRTADTYLTVS